MKLLALAAALFFAYASGEAFFGALRIDAASNERLEAARTKIQTLTFDVAAIQKKKFARTPQQQSLPQEYDSNLLEIIKQRDVETSAYEALVTWLFLEHKALAAPEDCSTSLAQAPLVSAVGELHALAIQRARAIESEGRLGLPRVNTADQIDAVWDKLDPAMKKNEPTPEAAEAPEAPEAAEAAEAAELGGDVAVEAGAEAGAVSEAGAITTAEVVGGVALGPVGALLTVGALAVIGIYEHGR